MTFLAGDPAVDQVRVSVLVEVAPEGAFRIFTEDIDLWWRRGLKYRVVAARAGTIHLEPGLGGRLYESITSGGDTELKVTGQVTAWDPPRQLCFEWRAVNFEPGDTSEVEVLFGPTRSGTRVTVTHRGWNRIRGDHPVRHGLDAEGFCGVWVFGGGDCGSLHECECRNATELVRVRHEHECSERSMASRARQQMIAFEHYG